MEKVISKRHDFIVDAVVYIEWFYILRFWASAEIWVPGLYVQFWRFLLLRKQESFAVTGDDIFFAVSWGKESAVV